MRASVAASTRPRLCAWGQFSGCTTSANVTGAALMAEPKIAAEAHTALNHGRLLSLIMKLL